MRPWIAVAVAALAVGLSLVVNPARAAEPAAVDYSPLKMQEGVWDADITFFDPATGQPSGSARGVQTNTLLMNGHWVLNDMKVFGAEGQKVTFEGRGLWGWDKAAREYIDTWVDTNDGPVRIDHGFWKADTRTMYWTALQSDGEGRSVNLRMTEVYDGDLRTLTFHQVALQSGRLVKMAEMKFRRRKG